VCLAGTRDAGGFRKRSPQVRGEATLTGFAPDVDISQDLNAVMLSNFIAWAATHDAFASRYTGNEHTTQRYGERVGRVDARHRWPVGR